MKVGSRGEGQVVKVGSRGEDQVVMGSSGEGGVKG